ncbi:MAG: acetylxylan esterase [Mediterranea sp.]|jgi:cephalosporin-C deacetylase-like acetyl esterase|nr:acetylxylan esterase [Mediterranea sp.]
MKKTLLLLLCGVCTLLASAQIRGEEIRVLVSPDHADWQYRLGETCTFTVRVLKAENPLPDVMVDYELGPEMYPTEKRQGVHLKGGTLTLRGRMAVPGFLRCKVQTTIGGRTYEGLATAGYAPEQIAPATTLPDDFGSYWKGVLRQARTLPLDPRMRLLPERCTATDNVYEVSFNTQAGGGRFFGILSLPKAEGKYPALLRVPGAGVRPYTGDTYTAPGRVITLEVGIHGIPVTLPQAVYDGLATGALSNYWTFRRDRRDDFYYHRVVVGALRAVDLLCSLPQFDGRSLGVTGSSQGGALSVITAALDTRVTFLASVHPALCDHEAYFSHRAAGWPHYFRYYGEPNEQQRATARYYDTVNFARLLRVSAWFSFGYNDEVCPPTSMYAAYNADTALKELHLYLQTGHFWYQEQWDAWQEWIRGQLHLSANNPFK